MLGLQGLLDWVRGRHFLGSELFFRDELRLERAAGNFFKESNDLDRSEGFRTAKLNYSISRGRGSIKLRRRNPLRFVKKYN
jgi:hypothetical protein